MTLNAKQSGKSYASVAFKRAPPNISEVARKLQEREQPLAVFADRPVATESTDSGLPSYDELVERIEPLRARLAMRRIKGEALARDESTVLAILNHRLAQHLPRPEPVPVAVKQAMVEAELLLKKYAGG